MTKVSCRTSYGIAICRYNKEKNNRPEILMIKKRCTYSYFDFVFGNYKKQNDKHLKYLFNNMTSCEKVDILSMRFSNMWYRIWLNYFDELPIGNNYHNRCFLKKKNKFETVFLSDGGYRLKKLINESFNSTATWEIPKGGKNKNEKDVDCAMRELTEETGILKTKYNIIWKPPIISSHMDNGILYKNVYFIAYTDDIIQPKVNFKNKAQLSEIDNIKWVSYSEIEFLQLTDRASNYLTDLFKKIIKTFKLNKKNN